MSNEKSCASTSINWYIPTNGKPLANPYKQRHLIQFPFTFSE